MNNFFDESFIQLTEAVETNAEFIPLITAEEEEVMNKDSYPDVLPILPLRNNVLFPGVVIPITVGRDRSIKLVQETNKGDKIIGVVSQEDQRKEQPLFDDLNRVGTVAQIIRLLKMPDGSSTVIIQGKKRFEMVETVQNEPYLKAKVNYLDETKVDFETNEMSAMIDTIKDLAVQIIQESPNIPSDAVFAIKNIDSPTFLINFLCSNMNLEVSKKQVLLEELDTKKRMLLVLEYLDLEVQMLQMRNKIQSKVRRDMDQQQREYFLNQQIRAIQDELGGSPQEMDVNELQDKAQWKKWTKPTQELFKKELSKFSRMNPQGAEYTTQFNYLELLVDLPWGVFSKDNYDLHFAKKILDRDHYGMKKVKERILEYLSVHQLKNIGNKRKRNKKPIKAPILCFYGPPGVGKTSLGRSIAESMGRKYVRMSLGGLHDESEIRGHRKTYIGAMPGRIIQNLKKVKVANPVFVLDEVDKLGKSLHGDPSSALLEVLDPEQNHAFYDNYVETEFDLSQVMFIATANNISEIPAPLLDRMELIEVNGYTIEEKIEIAKRHLLPKQLIEHGLEDANSKDIISIDNEVIEKIIENYTHESGVRGLDKTIAKIVRTRIRQHVMSEKFEPQITQAELKTILGPGRERTKYDNNDVAGVVTGLAWTSVGGDILFIESSITEGTGKLTLTGNLGTVMKESAMIALEFLKAHSHWFDIEQKQFDTTNVHIHVPEGATPKDGPSAGITMLTALASAFTRRKVKKHIAMTGEITLRGEVLPVGGIKEKILAAKRAKIKEIILCEKNKQDINEIEPEYIVGLKFHYVSHMKEVLDIALTKQIVALTK